MTRLIVDPQTLARLRFSELAEVCDESGHTLGYFHPARKGNEGELTIRSPFTRDELEKLRQERDGRALRGILSDLDRSVWESK